MKKNPTTAFAENKAHGKIFKVIPAFLKGNSIVAFLIAIGCMAPGFYMDKNNSHYSIGFIAGFIYTIFLYRSLKR